MKKQRTTDVFKSERKTEAETAVAVVPGKLKIEHKRDSLANIPGRVGDILQTAYYERKHTGKDADDAKWTEWVRTGTRFYQVTGVATNWHFGNLKCSLEYLTPNVDDDPKPAVDYFFNPDKWVFSARRGEMDRKTRERQASWQPWEAVFAEEVETWHIQGLVKEKPLTSTQFAAFSPKNKQLPWPVIDIVLDYSNVTFKDVGFPRKPMRYDASGPIPRLIGSLG